MENTQLTLRDVLPQCIRFLTGLVGENDQAWSHEFKKLLDGEETWRSPLPDPILKSYPLTLRDMTPHCMNFAGKLLGKDCVAWLQIFNGFVEKGEAREKELKERKAGCNQVFYSGPSIGPC